MHIRAVRLFVGALSFLTIVIAFQNCSSGFQPLPASSINALYSAAKCYVENGSGTYVNNACQIRSCDEGFHVNGQSCESDDMDCTIPNGIGQRVWSKGEYGACNVVSCGEGYEISGNSCLLIDEVTPDPKPRDPSTIFPKMMQANAIKDALDRPLTHFEGAGNSNKFGSAMVVLAVTAFAGDQSTDKRVLDNMRYAISGGREPSAEGGVPAQMELRFAVAAALVRLTPRLWNAFTAAEKSKIELVVKGLLVSGAYTSSKNNFEIKAGIAKARSLRSGPLWWKGNPNFKYAGPATVVAARAFFGSAAEVTRILNTFDKKSFAGELNINGLTNMYETFRENGPSGEMGARPTAVQIESAVKDWVWVLTNTSVGNIEKIIGEIANGSFNKKVNAGANNGAGIMYDGSLRAIVLNNPGGLPNKGELGMATELDSVDAEGVRSSMSYSFFGSRIVCDALTVALVANLVDKSSTVMKQAGNRVHIGMTDLEYKSSNGYYSYAHGGEGANNDRWVEATKREEWAWDYTFSHWFDVLRPALQ